MRHLPLIGTLAATLALGGCGSSQQTTPPHSDSIDFTIDASNALVVAATVYAALGAYVPFVAANAMAADGSVNTALCSSGSVSGEMQMNADGSMGMVMVFDQCTLSPSPTTHALMVDGRCESTLASDGTRTLKGERVDFTEQAASQNRTWGVHNFQLTLKNEQLASGQAYLHYTDSEGTATLHVVAKDFAGPAEAPTAGTLTIRGQDSAAKLTVNGDGTFDLEVDTDGDGTFETTDLDAGELGPVSGIGLDWNTYLWNLIN